MTDYNNNEPLDMNQIRAEIEAEAEELRRSDSDMARLEREVIQVWKNIAPPAALDDNLYTLESIERLARLNVDMPPTHRRGTKYIKKVIHKVIRWHTQHLANQIEVLMGMQLRYLQAAEKRILDLERLCHLDPATFDLLDPPPGTSEQLATLVADLVEGDKCLVVSCGEGTLVEAIHNNGIDVYGVEEDPRRILPGLIKGLDLRSENIFEHLSNLDDNTRDTFVLTGIIDVLPLPNIIHLVDEVLRITTRPGRLIVVTQEPKSRTQALAELHKQRGISNALWLHILERAGYSSSDLSLPEVVDANVIFAQLQ